MSLIKELEKDIIKVINTVGYNVVDPMFQSSNRPDLGQYQINCAMGLAKQYGKNPREIATDIVNELQKDNRFTNINIAG